MSDATPSPVPVPQPTAPTLPDDPQARQIMLLERIVEQQANLLKAAELQIRILNEGTVKTRVTDFGMPFFSMLGLFLEAAFASIPAAILIGILWVIVTVVLGVMFR
jgi:hypothetical protein